MNLKRYAFMITVAAVSCLQADVSPIEAMNNSMRMMQKEMGSMFENMQKMHEQFYSSFSQATSKNSEQGINIGISEKEQNNIVQVTISGVTAEEFKALFNDKELTVKAPDATIVLTNHHNILSASVTQEIKEESKEQDKEQASFFTSSSNIQQMVAKPIDLENAIIEYNKEQKSLIIEIPYKDSKKIGKTIPVNVK